MPLLTILITQQSRNMSIRLCDMWFARVFVNMRQKHVILLTTNCVLEGRPIRKRGCVSWAGPRCIAVEHSMCSATRRFWLKNAVQAKIIHRLTSLRDRITRRHVCSGQWGIFYLVKLWSILYIRRCVVLNNPPSEKKQQAISSCVTSWWTFVSLCRQTNVFIMWKMSYMLVLSSLSQSWCQCAAL